ncbi:MAG: GHKL domain-containing protein [Gracilimonas sp.]|uniref:sensor histidine kinase n=1 Tax=Gracilimonas TaxID=649462 RepID=UPI001AFF119C|nr:ATP-binding protein [Gracilimonas sp.]MBO6586365.1 GHKL domain-containing protein [Gracilimonas sp.]MBO6615022.1 GHKL domain-containing protein [Gracilimonas sp.]
MKFFNYFLFRFLLFVLMLFGPVNLAAQFYPAKTYSIVDGLPSNAIYDVVQADNSVMWFVTSKGVTTYDAHEWQVFPDSLQLPTYLSTKIVKSSDGHIWVAGKNDTEYVIKLFDDQKWSTIAFPETWREKQSAFSFEVMTTGDQHKIVLAGMREVHLYSTETKQWKQLTFSGGINPAINSTVNIEDRVYINTRKGQFAIENWEIVRSEYAPYFHEFQDVLTVTKKDSILYVLGFDWLAKIEDDNFKLLSDNLGIKVRSTYNRHSLVIDQRNRIFFSSNSRVMQFNSVTGKTIPLEVNGRTNNIFSNKLYLDKEQNIWSVDNRGLFKFNILNFKSYNRDSGLAENEVSAIFEATDGTLYIANPSHLHVLEDGQISRQYSLKTNQDRPTRLSQITEHYDGSLYLAAGAAGLYQLKNGALSPVFESHSIQYVTGVQSFDGHIYFSNSEFIYRIEEDGTFSKLNEEAFYYIRNIVELDEDKLAFLSAREGLYLYKDGEVTNYNSGLINYNNIYDAVYWQDRLLLGTSAGLATLDGDQITPFQISNFDDVVFSLLVDRKSQLWIGTFNGVFKWDGQTLEQFSVAQGLTGNEINRNALIQDKEGDIWIGTELGVSAYDEDEDMSAEKDPDLYFTSVRTEDNRELTLATSPELAYTQNTLTFRFKGISFLYNDRIFYRYRLSGLEDDWNFSNNFSNPGVTYRNLDSGFYTFEVQARNEISDWSESREFTFTIAKPFYSTWWFFGLAVILFAVIIYIALRLRYLYLITKQKKLKEMVEDRTRSITDKNLQIKSKNEELLQVNKELHEKTDSLNSALNKLETAQVKLVQKEKMAALGVLTAGVAHEINNPVNYIKSASELISQMIEEEDDKLVIEEKEVFQEVFKTIEIGVGRIVSIVRSLSSFSRTNETDKGDCDINSIFDECLLILKNEYKGRVDIVKDYSEKAVTIQGNEGKLYQLFTNIIMNAIQAIEGEGVVSIKTWNKDHTVYIEVKDTGKGFDETVKEKLFDPFFTTKEPGKGTGLGLSIAYNIVEEHNGEIHYDSAPGAGTTVTVKFPEKQVNDVV